MLAVVSDRKKGINDNGTMVYVPEILSYADYSPYGTLLHARHSGSDGYRYGFQGQERDDEIKGAGNSYNYTYRMHDPRIGRFFAIDPLAPKYPWYTPYQFSGNKLIDHVELEGLEETKSVLQQMGAYQQYESSKYKNPGFSEASPLGAPLEDYIPLDQNRIIDQNRNPQKYWIPGCMSNGGTPCEFIQYGRWETTFQSSSQTGNPVVANVGRVNSFGRLTPIGAPIVNAFVPDSPLTGPVFDGAMTLAINGAIAAPTPPGRLGVLPIGLGVPGPVVTISNTTTVNDLTTTNTIVTQQNFVRIVNSTIFSNSIAFDVNSAAGNNAASINFMNVRAATISGNFNNPFVPVVLNNLTFNSPIRPNSVQLFNTLMRTDFTTSWTTTVTTTTVTTTTFNFMRNRSTFEYIPTKQ